MVDSPRKIYLKTLVRRPRIPRCPNGNQHCEEMCMGAKRPENIGRYYYYVSNILDTTDIFTYLTSSAKRRMEKCLASTLQFTGSQCTLNRVLISAPQIPAGFRWFRQNPVHSRGIEIGRGLCQYCHSGCFPFRWNPCIPELILECSPEFTGTECNRNTFSGIVFNL